MKLIADLLRLRKNEKRSREEILSLQNARFSSLLHFAWEHSAYYHESFVKAGLKKEDLCHCSLSRIPIMDKETLMDHFDEVITTGEVTQKMLCEFDESHEMADKELPGGYHIVHSSGSTGEPQFFLYDADAWDELMSGIVRGALWGMTIPQIIKLFAGGIRILYIAAADGRYGGVMAVDDAVLGLGGRFRSLDLNRPLTEWEETIREYRPNVVIAYPSALKILAGLVEKEKVSLSLKRIITCGEPLSASLREYLEKIFGLPIINFYGASESLAIGVETDPEEGMVLFDDMNIVEVQDGELLITCLYNYAQPIIRYRIKDQMQLSEAEIHPSFSRAKGQVFREEDVLWFQNENGQDEYLHPLAIEGFCIEGLLDYQFVQESNRSFRMLAQITGEDGADFIKERMHELMGRILKEKHLTNVRFEISFIDKILPDTKTGKKRLILAQT